VQELIEHKAVKMTMIYNDLRNRGPIAVRSPKDEKHKYSHYIAKMWSGLNPLFPTLVDP